MEMPNEFKPIGSGIKVIRTGTCNYCNKENVVLMSTLGCDRWNTKYICKDCFNAIKSDKLVNFYQNCLSSESPLVLLIPVALLISLGIVAGFPGIFLMTMGFAVLLALTLMELFYWKADRSKPKKGENKLVFAIYRKLVSLIPAVILVSAVETVGAAIFTLVMISEGIIGYFVTLPPNEIIKFIIGTLGIVLITTIGYIGAYLNSLKFKDCD